jgi:hypothetical protein
LVEIVRAPRQHTCVAIDRGLRRRVGEKRKRRLNRERQRRRREIPGVAGTKCRPHEEPVHKDQPQAALVIDELIHLVKSQLGIQAIGPSAATRPGHNPTIANLRPDSAIVQALAKGHDHCA